MAGTVEGRWPDKCSMCRSDAPGAPIKSGRESGIGGMETDDALDWLLSCRLLFAELCHESSLDTSSCCGPPNLFLFSLRADTTV